MVRNIMRFCVAALLSLCLLPAQGRAQATPDSGQATRGALKRHPWAKRPIHPDSATLMAIPGLPGMRARVESQLADLVLVGGRIFTGDQAQPWAEAVAIRGDVIAAVGSDVQVRPLAGPSTRIVELAGKLVIPGIKDAQTHRALTVEQAVRAYTSGSASTELQEKRDGTIAPGLFADLTVLSKDIFGVPKDQIPGTTSVMTIVGGNIVWQQPRDTVQAVSRRRVQLP